MFRTVRRWFSDQEVKQLATEVDRVLGMIQDQGIKVESLALRIERYLSKVSMRELRSSRRDEQDPLSPEDRELLESLKDDRPPTRGDPFG